GFSDLAIGIPNKTQSFIACSLSCLPLTHPQSGAVVVIYGSPNGLTTTDPNFPKPQQLDLSILRFDEVEPDNAHFGQSLAWGNFNGDNFNGNPIGDLAIGLPDAAIGPSNLPSTGAVIVVAGTARFGFNSFLLSPFIVFDNSASQSGQMLNARFGA